MCICCILYSETSHECVYVCMYCLYSSHAESVEVERSELRRLEERVRQLEREARQQTEEKTTAIDRLTRERG